MVMRKRVHRYAVFCLDLPKRSRNLLSLMLAFAFRSTAMLSFALSKALTAVLMVFDLSDLCFVDNVVECGAQITSDTLFGNDF